MRVRNRWLFLEKSLSVTAVVLCLLKWRLKMFLKNSVAYTIGG